jgi:hypothetical protein
MAKGRKPSSEKVGKMTTRAKIIVIIVTIAPFVGLWGIYQLGKHRTETKSAPEEPAPTEAEITAAINAVQNYPTPSGDTVLKKIAVEVTRYKIAGRIVSFGGWMAEKEGYRYKVTCMAEVDGKNLWWVFYYYPGSGNVEPRRDFGRAKEVWR